MVVSAREHINNSVDGMNAIIDEVKALLEGEDERSLNLPEAEGKWSMLQCLKHMSIAVQVYNQNIEKAFYLGRHANPADQFKSHWKGDMFTKMISPKDNGEVKNNMKTFKTMDPQESLDAQETIQEFFRLHERFRDLIQQSSGYNLNRLKVNTALGPLVKLRLGDAFRFIIGHAQRHVIQLKRIKATVHQPVI